MFAHDTIRPILPAPRPSRRLPVTLVLALCLALPAGSVAGQPCPTVVDDTIILPDGCTYTVTGVEIFENVYVMAGGTLNLAAGAVLTITDTLYVDPEGFCAFIAADGVTPRVRSASEVEPVLLDGDFTVTGGAGAAFDRVSNGAFRLVAGGSITSDAGPVTLDAPMDSAGSITATGGSIVISGSLENDATLTADGGNLLVTGSVTNDGTIVAGGGNITIGGALNNNAGAAVVARGGNLTTIAAVTNAGEITADGGDVRFIGGDVANTGTITATGGSDVTFTGTLNPKSGGLFQVTAAGSDMVFDLSSEATLTADGDFNLVAGRMFFAVTVSTAGGYRQTGGVCEVAAGASFRATGAY